MDLKHVGERIRYHRERKAWTQEHLGGAAAISARTVQRAEEGTMSSETLTAIAGALGVAVEVLTAAPTPKIVPVLIYDDTNAAIAWLERAFGFTTRAAYPDGTGKIVHAELLLAEALVMIGPNWPSQRFASPKSTGGVASQALYVYVDDLDDHCARARAAGAKILIEPAEAHGERRYLAEDPEGQRFWFAQPTSSR